MAVEEQRQCGERIEGKKNLTSVLGMEEVFKQEQGAMNKEPPRRCLEAKNRINKIKKKSIERLENKVKGVLQKEKWKEKDEGK